MAGTDSPELAIARENLDKAIKAYVDVAYDLALERNAFDPADRPFVLGWVMEAEYVNAEMQRMEQTASAGGMPDNQPYAFSRGLHEVGADRYSRITR
jgi:hypothetical protein